MAVATTQATLNSTQTIGFASVIKTAKTRFARYRLYRRTFNELSALSNRELADLGLHRSAIRRVSLQAAQEYTAR